MPHFKVKHARKYKESPYVVARKGMFNNRMLFFMAVFPGNQFNNPGLASVADTGRRSV